ncbi:MAG: hypothetical protein O3C60_11225 [Planctomycetota bacterium]|nr:hypothetical protein [Planctomycetota bacterium]
MQTVMGLIHFQAITQSKDPFHLRQCMASRRFGRQTLLDWLMSRVSQAEQLQSVGVLVPPDLHSLLIERIPLHVQVVPAQGRDAIHDLLAALEMGRADSLVLVGIERPFVDPSLIDELVLTASASRADYASYYSRQSTTPQAIQTNVESRIEPEMMGADPVGIGAEWCSGGALRKVDSRTKELPLRAQGAQLIAANAQEFKVNRLALPLLADRRDLRLAIDNSEDWDHALTLFEALGPEGMDWRRVTGLLDQNPEIRQRMARLNGAEDMNRPHLRVQNLAAR